MTKLEALAKDCIENHTHRLVDKPTKQDIYLREESIFIQGYRQSEKRIAELEKSCDETQELLDKQIEATYKLYKENAELKEDNSEWEKASDKWKSVYELTNNQLANAKEIIREFMKYEINEYDGSLEIHFEELKKQAEQFLNNEVEK